MTETTEALLFRQAEQLQNEAKNLQSKASDLYRGAAEIKQLIVTLVSKNTTETESK